MQPEMTCHTDDVHRLSVIYEPFLVLGKLPPAPAWTVNIYPKLHQPMPAQIICGRLTNNKPFHACAVLNESVLVLIRTTSPYRS